MTRLLSCVLSAVLLAAADRGAPAAASRVVLLSVDAGSDVLLDRLLASGALKAGGFARIAARGLTADSMTPAAVSSTPVSHATLFAGAWPDRHGITGVAVPGDDVTGPVQSGFAMGTDVERLWTIAKRAGKRVVCIGVPGADATRPDNTCTETVPFAAIGTPQGAALEADPRSLIARLRLALGTSPGEPQARQATQGAISEDDYVAHANHYADYVGGAVSEELARADWDLLIVYLPILDNVLHRYLLRDSRQAEYRDEEGARRQRFDGYVQRAFRKVDALIAGWLEKAPAATFLLVSDHGMIPTHSTVLINNVLAAAGLRVEGADAEVRALSSGASAQVYVNTRGRFQRGVVVGEQVIAVVQKAMDALRRVRDPITGMPVFSTIARGPQIVALNLGHRNTGDVYVSAVPGWGVSGRFDPAVPPIVPNTLSPDVRRRISRSPAEKRFLENGGLNELSLGIHGHRPDDQRTQAWFMAIGPEVPHRRIGVVHLVDVAPTALRLLGIEPPRTMSGRPIW